MASHDFSFAAVQADRVQSLAGKYRDRLVAMEGAQATALRRAAMTELMREWNPIQSSRDDLKKVMGQPSRETEDVLEYEFDTGRGGSLWQFKLQGDLVVGVEMRSIN